MPWGIVKFIVKILPLPSWLKELIEAIIVAIDMIDDDVKLFQQEIKKAAIKAKTEENPEALRPIFEKMCTGMACPSDTKKL